jgi:hypothetical protein
MGWDHVVRKKAPLPVINSRTLGLEVNLKKRRLMPDDI